MSHDFVRGQSVAETCFSRIGVMSDLCHVGPTRSPSLMSHVGPTMSDLSTMSDLYASTRSALSSLKYILKQVTALLGYYRKITTLLTNTQLFIHSNIDNRQIYTFYSKLIFHWHVNNYIVIDIWFLHVLLSFQMSILGPLRCEQAFISSYK